MFTIDLLKGKGVPIRCTPVGIAIAGVATAVPAIVTIVVFGLYLNDKIVASTHRQRIANCAARIERLANEVSLSEALRKEDAYCRKQLAEVNSSVGRYTQWSPVLAALTDYLPEPLVLTALDVKQSMIKKKIPRKDDPKQLVDTSIPVTTLRMSVCATPDSDSDKAVREFRDRLRNSDLLGPRLDNITVSQELDNLGGHDVMSYQVDCVFKPIL